MTMTLLFLLVCLSCCMDSLWAVTDKTPRELDKIETLPGLNFPLAFNQYSGFFELSGNHHGFSPLDMMKDRNIFYWFVESSNDPANDPIVVWTNGASHISGSFIHVTLTCHHVLCLLPTHNILYLLCV